MANIKFTIDPDGTATEKTIPLNKWKVRRTFTRARYKYVNGGNDSHYISYGYIFELEWAYLHQSEFDDIQAVVNAISVDKKDVRLDRLADKDYNLLVDYDSEEFEESSGEVFAKKPLTISFITRTAQT